MDINVPRLLSYRLKKATEGKAVQVLSLDDLLYTDLSRYGLIGSPTAVKALFAPPVKDSSVFIEGDSEEKARNRIFPVDHKNMIFTCQPGALFIDVQAAA